MACLIDQRREYSNHFWFGFLLFYFILFIYNFLKILTQAAICFFYNAFRPLRVTNDENRTPSTMKQHNPTKTLFFILKIYVYSIFLIYSLLSTSQSRVVCCRPAVSRSSLLPQKSRYTPCPSDCTWFQWHASFFVYNYRLNPCT